VSEGTNRKFRASRNTLVQLLALYTDPESHNAQHYRQTDRQTDGRHDDTNSRSYCLAVRSAKMGDGRMDIAGLDNDISHDYAEMFVVCLVVCRIIYKQAVLS